MSLKSKLSNLQENIPLAGQTTFRIGGPAKYFLVVKKQEDLVRALRIVKENDISFYLIGGGSNLLVSDSGFDGLIIKCIFSRIDKLMGGPILKLRVDAGTGFGSVIMETAKSGYSGIEWGFGIPGTMGGAICGNAGRLGQATAQVVKSVKVLDSNLVEKEIAVQDCGFDYRESRFKKTGEIILSADLEFQVKDQRLIDEILNEAKKVILGSPKFPSAGCVFKNYVVKNDDSLLRDHPELIGRVRGSKLGVGFLIDQCGLRGKQVGGAKIWEDHANYVINTGGASAADILQLIDLCKKEVAGKYDINLKEEIRYVGFNNY